MYIRKEFDYKSHSGDLWAVKFIVMSNKKIVMQAVKASRKQSREEEIKTHGKPVNYKKIVVSKKVYNRKKNKANHRNEGLPYSF